MYIWVKKSVTVILAILCLNSNVRAQFEDLSNSELKEFLVQEEKSLDKYEVYKALISNYMRINTDTMFFYATEFMQFAEGENNNLFKLKAEYHLGRYYAVKGESDMAIEYLEKAYSHLSYSEEPEFNGRVIGMMGYTYYTNGQYDTAIKYYRESLNYFKAVEDKRSTAIAVSTIGSIYFQLKDFEAAKKNYLESLLLKEEIMDSVLMSTDLTNIGLIYQKEGKLDSALVYALKALEIDKKFNNQFGLADIYGDISSIYRMEGDIDTAIDYAEKSLEIAQSVNSLPLIRDAHNLLYVSYREDKNIGKALENHEQFKVYSDSIINISTQEQLINAQEKYATEKKEQEIKLLEAENQSARLSALIAIIIAISVVIIISVIYWQISKRKAREKQLELTTVQRELENYGVLIAEKDTFLNGVVDRLKSMISELKSFESKKELTSVIDSLSQNVKLTDDEDQLFQRIEQVNSGFFRKLNTQFEALTKGDKRLASLVQMELSNKEIGNILGINPKSVVQARYRLKKKLELNIEDDLTNYLKSISG